MRMLLGVLWRYEKNRFVESHAVRRRKPFWIAAAGFVPISKSAFLFPRISERLSLSQLVEDYILLTGQRCFLVTTDGRLLGLITVHQVKQVPREAWSHRSVREVMIPFDRLQWVAPDAPLLEVLALIDEGDIGQAPVVHDGRLLGLIGRDHLLRVIRSSGVSRLAESTL